MNQFRVLVGVVVAVQFLFTVPVGRADVTGAWRHPRTAGEGDRFRVRPGSPDGVVENPVGNGPWITSATVTALDHDSPSWSTSSGMISSTFSQADAHWRIVITGDSEAHGIGDASPSAFVEINDKLGFAVDSEMEFRLQGEVIASTPRLGAGGDAGVRLEGDHESIHLHTGEVMNQLWIATSSGDFGAFDLRGRLTPGSYRLTVQGNLSNRAPEGSAQTFVYSTVGDLRVSDCFADLDGNGESDVLDLLTYLDHWFAGDAAAERTADDPATIDVFDLLVYLDEWFAGC